MVSYCVSATRFPSILSHCTTLPNLKRSGILMAFSNFSSCLQKKPQWAVENEGDTNVGRTEGRIVIVMFESAGNKPKPLPVNGFTEKRSRLLAAFFWEKAALTTKTVQKIKKMVFLMNILLLCV